MNEKQVSQTILSQIWRCKMKRQLFFAGFLVVLLGIALTASLTRAQEPPPPPGGEIVVEGEVGPMATVDDKIPIQGRLTDTSGNPISGTYNLTFRLYNVEEGGAPLCTSMSTVQVTNGLFSANVGCTSYINGQQLYLSVQVGSDTPMTPRQPIYPVPYAFSLRPGALISDTMSGTPLNVYNHGSGWGLDVYSAGHDAVHGRTGSTNHAGVAGVSWGSGIGVYGESNTGVAIKAAGSGIIQSTANSYVFVPGGEAQLAGAPSDASLRYWARGTVDVLLSSGSGVTRTVAFPVSLPAVLYGQPVRVTEIRVYYRTTDSATYISGSKLYREKPDGSFYTLISDTTDQTSTTFTSYDISCSEAECRLSDDEGFITVALDVYFASNSHSINLGGVRVTLEHD